MIYKKIREFICKVIGHNECAVVTGWNERSTWGWATCSRCGEERTFQYDENYGRPL